VARRTVGKVATPTRKGNMDRYIEVIGEGQFEEMASRFIAAVVLEVRASKDETALAEVSELFREAIVALNDTGITEEEIVEGGTDFYRPWYWKRSVGQNAARRILLKVKDFARLNRALEKLEPLQSRNKERKTVTVDMRQPEFDASSEAKAAALAMAFQDARDKAQRLAATMSGRLGRVIHAEEGGWAKRSSGFSGDEDWGGDSSRFAMGGGFVLAAAGAAAESEPELQKPTRMIFVKCRVRFELLDA
jgi:uncharacterized protein YggE